MLGVSGVLKDFRPAFYWSIGLLGPWKTSCHYPNTSVCNYWVPLHFPFFVNIIILNHVNTAQTRLGTHSPANCSSKALVTPLQTYWLSFLLQDQENLIPKAVQMEVTSSFHCYLAVQGAVKLPKALLGRVTKSMTLSTKGAFLMWINLEMAPLPWKAMVIQNPLFTVWNR